MALAMRTTGKRGVVVVMCIITMLLSASCVDASIASSDEHQDAPFGDAIGLTCQSQSDCGFLPGLACIEG